jgi:hypothetical protein
MAESLGASAAPRAQTAVDGINDRIANYTRDLRTVRDRVHDTADTLVGSMPPPPNSPTPENSKLSPVPTCTTQYLDELERVIGQLLHETSRVQL